MSERARSMEVKVGGLILTAVLLLVAFLILLGDFRCRDRVPLQVDFPTSADLKTGAPVKISGVTVGKVKLVDLWGGRVDPDHGDRPVGVRVTLDLDAAPARLLRDDAKFRITTLGILGEKYVEIFPGTAAGQAVPDGFVFEGVGPMNLDAVGADATTLVADISGVLKENRENLRESVAGIRKLVADADAVLVENRPAIKNAVSNLERLTKGLAEGTRDGEEVREVLVAIKGLAQRIDRGIGPTLEALPSAVRNVDRLAGQGALLATDLLPLVAAARPEFQAILTGLKLVVQDVRSGKGTVGGLLSDREIYDDLVAFMKDVKRHPWKLLLKE